MSVSPQRIFMRKLISKLELSDPEAMNSSARTPTAPVGKHHPFWTNMRLTNKSAGGGGPGKWEYQPILVVLQVPRNESLNQQDGRTIQQIVLLFEQQSVGL